MLLPPASAALIGLLLPGSIKFLAQRGGAEARGRRLASALRPDLPIGAAARFSTAAHPGAVVSGSPRGLFAGGLAGIAPALQLALAAAQMVNFFSLSWLPTLLQSAGSSTAKAALNASLSSIAGIAGGVCLTLSKLGGATAQGSSGVRVAIISAARRWTSASRSSALGKRERLA